VEEAQTKIRVPNSIRYQTEYINEVGIKLQKILNKQQQNHDLAAYQEDDQDSSE
jgi:hypothetical protein